MSVSDNESDWSDIAEDEVEVTNGDHADVALATCLFCVHQDVDVEFLFTHMALDHKVVIKDLVVNLKLDLYGYIKLINYVRKTKLSPIDANSLCRDAIVGDELLMPVLHDDMLLQYDVEEILSQSTSSSDTSTELSLEKRLGFAEERANLAEEFLARTIDDLNKCRAELKNLLLGGSSGGGTSKEKVAVNGHGNCDSDGYFSSYAHYGIHEEMLKDEVRTGTYRDFILQNKKLFDGARVLDVGCGTSILSMFCAKAGAKEVTGVDMSEVAYQAMDIVRENKLNHVVRIQKGRAEELQIAGKVDVIVSEWMGYFLLFESMLDTVLYCRDNYLSETGCIYPDKCNISLVALDDSDLYESKVKYWNDIHGYKMSAMKRCVIQEPLIAVVPPENVISKPFVLKEFDLMKVGVSDLDFEEEFDISITKDGNMSALVGYFDVAFEKNTENSQRFSTSPSDVPTHWKQTVFFLNDPVSVQKDDTVKGRLKCRKHKKDNRALDVTISILKDGREIYNQIYSMV